MRWFRRTWLRHFLLAKLVVDLSKERATMFTTKLWMAEQKCGPIMTIGRFFYDSRKLSCLLEIVEVN
ncbi:hypothetical protein ACB098_04G018100 [Castanea mollissima]